MHESDPNSMQTAPASKDEAKTKVGPSCHPKIAFVPKTLSSPTRVAGTTVAAFTERIVFLCVSLHHI